MVLGFLLVAACTTSLQFKSGLGVEKHCSALPAGGWLVAQAGGGHQEPERHDGPQKPVACRRGHFGRRARGADPGRERACPPGNPAAARADGVTEISNFKFQI